MKKQTTLIKITCLILAFNTSSLNAQNTWVQKSSSPTSSVLRTGAFSFTIGTKGYIGGGMDATATVLKTFWEYDPATDVWTQQANIPDIGSQYGRTGAIGFGIGNLGYFGTGNTSGSANGTSNFYEYNPITNVWTAKASFAGGTRVSAVGFSIGNKGYIGTGTTNFSTLYNDFWEYNPSTDTWTQKANFGGVARDYAVGFSISNKGYIGTGNTGTGAVNDFWEYNQTTDAWVQKANFGGGQRWTATAFSIGNYGYIGTGQNASNTNQNDFWEYDPNIDSWSQKANFSGNIRNSAYGFSVGSKGYIGGGINSPSFQSDFWEYTPSSISTGIENNNDHFLNLINVYPNPNNGNFNIKAVNECSVKITNELGQLIREIQLNAANNFTATLDGLQNGIYAIVSSNNKQSSSQKIVISK
ncbi:MAG: kelch repeat-containing protein [Bacteroidia bacterium]